MVEYGGNLYIIKVFFTYAVEYLFVHYVGLAGFTAVVAIAAGLLATVAEFVIPSTSPKRRRVLFIIAVLPILIGMVGTIIIAHMMRYAVLIEQKAGITHPSAYKYFDIECGYTKKLLFLFPLIIGIASAIPPMLTWRFSQNKKG